MRVNSRMVFAGAVVGALVAAPAEAQRDRGLVEVGESRWVVGVNALLARPTGEFSQFVDWGGGIGLYGVVHFDRGRHAGVRLDGTYVLYGHERFTTPLSPTLPRILVDVTTTNSIAAFALGPQVTFFRGPVQPYAYGTVGFSYFVTSSSASGSADFGPFATTTNFADVTPALSAGGGLALRVSQGRHPVSLDFSAQSTWNGEAEYLRRRGILETRDGGVILRPIRSEANLVLVRVGVAVGL